MRSRKHLEMHLHFGAWSVMILQSHGRKLFDYSCSADREQFHELSHAFYDPLAASQQQTLTIFSELVCTVLSSKITTLDYGNLLHQW